MKNDTYNVRPYHFGILTYDRTYLKELGNSDDSIDKYIEEEVEKHVRVTPTTFINLNFFLFII